MSLREKHLRICKCFIVLGERDYFLPRRRLTCVVAGYIYPHGWALPLARPPLLRRPGAVEVREGEAAALGCQLGEVELGMVVRPLHQGLEVEAAVHQAVLHAEVVARGQRFVARGAREAAQVVHGVARPHHHLRGRDPEVAARAPLHGEPSGTDKPSTHLTDGGRRGPIIKTSSASWLLVSGFLSVSVGKSVEIPPRSGLFSGLIRANVRR